MWPSLFQALQQSHNYIDTYLRKKNWLFENKYSNRSLFLYEIKLFSNLYIYVRLPRLKCQRVFELSHQSNSEYFK